MFDCKLAARQHCRAHLCLYSSQTASTRPLSNHCCWEFGVLHPLDTCFRKFPVPEGRDEWKNSGLFSRFRPETPGNKRLKNCFVCFCLCSCQVSDWSNSFCTMKSYSYTYWYVLSHDCPAAYEPAATLGNLLDFTTSDAARLLINTDHQRWLMAADTLLHAESTTRTPAV